LSFTKLETRQWVHGLVIHADLAQLKPTRFNGPYLPDSVMKGFGHALAYRAEGSAERGSKHAAHRPTPWAQSFLDEAKRPETWKGEKQDPPGAGTPSRPPPVV